MSLFQPPRNRNPSGIEPEQLQQLLATEAFKFTVGLDRVEFYIHHDFVSRLSAPLNAVVSGRAEGSLETGATWEDVDADIFSRFAQFLYTGSYTAFAPAEGGNTSVRSKEAGKNTGRKSPDSAWKLPLPNEFQPEREAWQLLAGATGGTAVKFSGTPVGLANCPSRNNRRLQTNHILHLSAMAQCPVTSDMSSVDRALQIAANALVLRDICTSSPPTDEHILFELGST